MFFQKKDFDQDYEPQPNLPEKTGTARFWELVKEELAIVLIVNLLFILTCLPVVTIPPALFSLHMVMRKIVLGEEGVHVRDYFTAFKQGWKRAYGAFFLTAVPMGIAGYGAVFYLRRAPEYPLLLVPFALCTTAFLVTMLSSTYSSFSITCSVSPLVIW